MKGRKEARERRRREEQKRKPALISEKSMA